MIRIAITGGIACGKSVVGEYLKESGVDVYDADEIVHAMFATDRGLCRTLADHFGRRILGPGGRIDRAKLGEIVFADAERREVLNGIIHPRVEQEWTRWLGQQEEGGVSRMSAVVIPLLFEGGFERGWDAVVAVCASRGAQMERLRVRGANEHDARARIEAQWPQWRKVAASDYVIVNDGTLVVLKEQVHRVQNHILEK